jgi:hypothetical protein
MALVNPDFKANTASTPEKYALSAIKKEVNSPYIGSRKTHPNRAIPEQV